MLDNVALLAAFACSSYPIVRQSPSRSNAEFDRVYFPINIWKHVIKSPVYEMMSLLVSAADMLGGEGSQALATWVFPNAAQ